MTSVTIPNSIKEICCNSFSDCEQLKDMHYKGTKDEKVKISHPIWNVVFAGPDHISHENRYLLRAKWHYLDDDCENK